MVNNIESSSETTDDRVRCVDVDKRSSKSMAVYHSRAQSTIDL